MKVSYYPGCSLHGSAGEYDESLRVVSGALGIELEELADWTCCGASSAHVTDDTLAASLAVRNVLIADRAGKDLVVPCAACFQRLKAAERGLRASKTPGGGAFSGKVHIKHSADFIWEVSGERDIGAKAAKRLLGLKPVCYYGCLTVRPPAITGAANPEDPQSLDDIMKVLGADVKNWSYKTDCCGGNLMLTHPEIARQLVKRLFDACLEAGGDCIVVACPMCHAALDTLQATLARDGGGAYAIPIYYFTELMALSFGHGAVGGWLKKHLTDARQLVAHQNLL